VKGLVVTAAHALELREISDPRPGPYEALVRIRACGICGTTDRELVTGDQPYNSAYPCLLGHEAVGVVVETGARVRNFRIGDWVTRPVGIWPGDSRDGLTSAWGGFATLGVVRDRQAMADDGDVRLLQDYTALRQNRVDATGLDERALVLAISLAETASWSWQLPPLGGATVCVAGTGIAGLSIALWAKLAGAGTVVVLGRRPERLRLARTIVADLALDSGDDWAGQLRRQSPSGIDVFCEAVGSPALLRQGVGLLRPGGTAAVYGVAPRGQAMQVEGLTEGRRLVVPEAREHLAYAWVLDLMRRRVIDAGTLMTHRWPLHQAVEAFRTAGTGEVLKGMLDMPAD
jgi:threonine dehydrogenase-like Zn-dependent dehydrogenase